MSLLDLFRRCVGKAPAPTLSAGDLFNYGYYAAMHGESRAFVSQSGADALEGYDAFWREHGPECVPFSYMEGTRA